FELEPASRRIRRIIFSPDGELGPAVESRQLSAISLVHSSGEIELVPYSESDAGTMPAVPDVSLLSRSTRLMSNTRYCGVLQGLEVDPAAREISTVFGRQHWWSRRLTVPAERADFGSPGEIRIYTTGTKAA